MIPFERESLSVYPRPRLLESSSFRFGLRAVPMLGCIGVAMAGYEILSSRPAGPHDGNMDYNDVVEGATLFFPCRSAARVSQQHGFLVSTANADMLRWAHERLQALRAGSQSAALLSKTFDSHLEKV